MAAMPLAPLRFACRPAAPLALALGLLLAPPATLPAAAQEAPAFRVLNRTGTPATALYAARIARPDWGQNVLREGPLPAEHGFSMRAAPAAGCRFDFRLVLEDGRQAVLRDQDICVSKEVAVTPGAIGAADPRPAAAAVAPVPPRPAPGAPAPTPAPAPGARPNPQARLATGSGFVVAAGRVMTNHHVVDGCDRLMVRLPDGRMLAAVPPAQVDRNLDLALLNVPGLPGPGLAFRSGPAIRRGEGVVAYGFPLSGLLSSDAKLTRGEINGLAGLRDNPNVFQISAEVQPGNSGGPLLDMQGNVVGVVVAKLNAQSVARRTGDIAQNVNFAVKGELAAEFLRRAGQPPRMAASTGPERSAADVGEVADAATVFIRCEK